MKSATALALFLGTLGIGPACAAPLPATTQTALDSQLRENHQRYGSVSQSVLLLKNGERVYRGLEGKASLELAVPVTASSKYPVYSLAKLFASVTLMSLMEQGKIDLDIGIGHYLPNLPGHWHAITLRHCLNHTSGLPEYFSMAYVQSGFPADTSEIYAQLKDAAFQFKTGERNRYNNTNYLIIGDVIAKVAGASYLSQVTDRVLAPLALKHTLFAPANRVIPGTVSSYWGNKGKITTDKGVNWPDYAFVHSGLYSTAEDIARFMTGITRGEVLKKETLRQMWQPMLLNNGTPGEYAAGWQYSANDKLVQVGHEGGNRVRLSHYLSPTMQGDNYTLVYLTNGDAYDGWTSQLMDSLMAEMAPAQFPHARSAERLLDAAFAKETDAQLDELAKTLSNNTYVQQQGLERFVMIRAYNLLYSANPRVALPLFRLNTRLFPDSPGAWNNLARAWQVLGDEQQADTARQHARAVASPKTVANH